LRFIERRGIGNALRALFTWKGIDDEVRRADQSLVHGPSGLEGDERIHEGLVKAAAKLAERGGEHEMGLRRIEVVLPQATRVHDREVGAQPVTDRLIGGTQLMLEQFEGQQDTDGHGPSAALGCFGEAVRETLLDRVNHGGPGKRIGPSADGIAVWDEVGDMQGGTATAYPMLKIAHKTHPGLSS